MRPILLFSEDPGATNCLLPLLPLLAGQGTPFRILAAGVASGMYERHGYRPEPALVGEQLLAELRPALLVTGTAANPDTPGLDLIVAARRLGIPSLGIVDALMNAELRFSGRSGNPLAKAPDWLAVPDAPTADRFAGLGVARERLVVSGHPHFDAVLGRAEELKKSDRRFMKEKHFSQVACGRKVILFAGEPDAHFRRGADYLLTGRGGWEGRSGIVMEEFLDALSGLAPRPAAFLLLHPRSRREDWGSLTQEFDAVLQGGETLELVYGADCVCGLSSMLLTEAALLGRPTLSILPRRAERDWLPGIGWGATNCVHERAALPAALHSLLEQGEGPDLAGKLVLGADQRLLELIERISHDH